VLCRLKEVGFLDMPDTTPLRLAVSGTYLFVLGSNRDFYAVKHFSG